MKGRIIKLSRLCCLLLMIVTPAVCADWTGISASIDEIESDWIFENNQRSANTTRLNLQFEERTHSGLGVGANIGRLTTRISNVNGPRNTVKFDASYFGIYLRYPLQLGEYFTLHSKFGYQFHSGSGTDNDTNDDEIEWREVGFEIGLSGRFENFRITPFMLYSDVDGDISDDMGTDSFENEENVSAGLSLDLFLDPTSFVRLRFTSGEQDSTALVFAREF